jgi:hypothetical protein
MSVDWYCSVRRTSLGQICWELGANQANGRQPEFVQSAGELPAGE